MPAATVRMPWLAWTNRIARGMAATACVLLAGPVAAMAATAAPAPAATPAASGPRYALCDTYCALVDEHGTLVSRRLYEHVESFDGPVALYTYQGRSGAIDADGHTLVPPVYKTLYVVQDQPFLLAEADMPAGATAASSSAPVKDDDGAERSNASSGSGSGSSGSGDSSSSSDDKVVAPAPPRPVAEYVLYDFHGRVVLARNGNMVGAWQGHPYYHDCPRPDAPASACSYVFVDGHGKPALRLAYFLPVDDTLAPASLDGKHFGYIGPKLEFAVAPTYTGANPFEGNYARISTAQGGGLIDRRGRVIAPPGRYAGIYPDRDSLLITAFPSGERHCAHYLRDDGSRVPLPAGLCPYDAGRSRALGYALVTGPQGLGAVDISGHLLIAATHTRLLPLDAGHLAYSDSDSGNTAPRYGVLDTSGKPTLPMQYLDIKAGPAGTFIVRDSSGWGLANPAGKWLVPPQYADVRVLSPQLLSFKVAAHDGHGAIQVLFRPDGTRLPDTSLYEPEGVRELGNRQFAWKIYGPDRQTGLIGADGHPIVPLQRFSGDPRPLGDGWWLIHRDTPQGAQDQVYDAHGARVTELAPYTSISPFVHGAATARTHDGDAVLIDRGGHVLASYAALFPLYTDAARGDAVIEQSLDRCYVADPAAEPAPTAAQDAVDRKICADPALRALSRATEKAYYGAQSGPCVPQDFMALRRPYDKELAQCRDSACLEHAMRAFQARMAGTARQCAQSPATLKWLDHPVEPTLRVRLRRLIVQHGKNFVADPGSETDNSPEENKPEEDGLVFHALSLGGRVAVLAVQQNDAHNAPFWLLLRDRPGKGGPPQWRIVLENYGGYLRPLEATDAVHNGLPVLRTQQHVSCCEHQVDYYAYDGRRYAPSLQCTQLYDGDSPVLLCGDAAPAGPDSAAAQEQEN